MEIIDLQKRSLKIREKYKKLEIKKDGSKWSTEQLIKGFMKDVNDLFNLVKSNSEKEKLKHELSDCLWSVLVLADEFNIDIEQSFLENMNKLEKRINKELDNYKD